MSDELDRAGIARRVEELFARSGAYREGHFKLKSGRHGDRYLEKFQVLQWPLRVAEICTFMDRVADDAVDGEGFDVVIGPTTGGVILAHEVARNAGTRGIFAEQVVEADGTVTRQLRRGFRIEPGDRVLIVDDVVTTGASLLEMIPLVESSGGELCAIVVIVDRSGELDRLVSPATGRAYRADALWTLTLPTYEPGPQTCPGCAAVVPLETPGASGTKAGGAT